MDTKFPDIDDVVAASERIKGLVWETPLIDAALLSRISGAESLLMKMESFQNTGAFKVRGAANRILSLSRKEREKGVITFSTGNHGKAVSYVSGKTGIKAFICLSENVPRYRVEKIRELGAEVIVKGNSQDEAENYYLELMEEKGLIPVVPFDDPYIIAGQGTVALEILKTCPDIDVLLVPLSGGGLLAGTAMAAKTICPSIHVVGVSIEQSPAMLKSLEAGRPVAIEEKKTLADSLLGGIGRENKYSMELIREYVDEHVLISEEEIAESMAYAFLEHNLVIEGASAVGLAAVKSGKIDVSGKKVSLIISGSSVDPSVFLNTVQKYL